MKLKHITKRTIVLLLSIILFSGCIAPRVANSETPAYGLEAGPGQQYSPAGSSVVGNNSILPSVSDISDPDALADAENAYRERMQQEHAEAILAESKIADYVNTADFLETKPMFRLEALEQLNTYVVQNADNTNTIYFMSENVKYVDDKGEIREKDVRLSATEKGYSVTDSDVKLLLPLKLSDGIDVNTDFGSLSLIPQLRAESAAKFNEKSNSVLYSGAFGSGSSLRYTPTLSGVKEDIILETRPEENSFEFRMETQGLYLAEEDGIYYLVSTDNKDSRIRLNQIYIYDANGRFTAGKMSVIDEGRGKFLLTVTAPREFLDDANTVYPVVIDPSLEIGTMSDTSLIIDAPVFALKPNLNAGTWQYESIGYTDSTYGLARTVVKLSGLLSSSAYQNVTVDKITNVTFSAKEATGNSTKTVKLHPITGSPTWTETSVTWNNYGSFDTSANYGGTLSGDQWTNFNITNLVKAWKNGSYNGNGCFIFIMSGTESSQCRALYSTEYSGITNRPYVSMTYQGSAAMNQNIIYVNEGSITLPSCTVSPAGTYHYSWSVDNTSIASCLAFDYSYTMLSGIHAGKTNLRVEVRDAAGEFVDSAFADVYVRKPDGIYNISNVYYSGKLLSVGKTLSDEMDVFVRGVTYSSNDPVTDRITQMWRVKHVAYNMYTIRPYYKLDMRMGRDDDNTVIVGDAGMEDTYNYQLSDYFWWITWDESEQYIIKCDNTTKLLTAASEQTLETPVYAQANSNPGLKAKWNFTNVTSTAPTGMYLYDKETDEIVSNGAVKYVSPGETIFVAVNGILPVAFSSNYIDQSFYWYSSNTYNISILQDGTLIGNKSSDNLISVSINWNLPGMTNISASYDVKVLKVRNGTYTIQNCGTHDFAKALGINSGAPAIIDCYYQFDDGYQWEITRAYKQYYSIISEKTGLAFSLIDGSSFSLESDIIQSAYCADSWQLWSLDLSQNNNIIIKSQYAAINNSNYVAGVTLIVGGNTIKQLDYTNNSNFKDEWVLNPASIQYWYSDETVAYYWKRIPSIGYDNRSMSSAFYYDSSILWALSEWENHLDISLPYSPVSSADIVVIGDTRSNLAYENIPAAYAGMTRYNDCGISGYTKEMSTGSIVELTELQSATIFLIDDGYSEDSQKNIATHELGHALGFCGHASGMYIDVMYQSMNGIIELSFRDYYHILQLWIFMTH